MEVKILYKFHDRADFTKVYPVGETFTFDDARADDLIKRGLVEAIAEEEESPVEEAVESPVVEEEAPVEEESIEDAAEPVEVIKEEGTPESPVVEEKAIKPVATKRRSASKDN